MASTLQLWASSRYHDLSRIDYKQPRFGLSKRHRCCMLDFIGQLGRFVGVNLYLKGMAICACSMATVAVLAHALRRMLIIENRKMDVEDFKVDGEDQGLVVRNSAESWRKQFNVML